MTDRFVDLNLVKLQCFNKVIQYKYEYGWKHWVHLNLITQSLFSRQHFQNKGMLILHSLIIGF